MQVIAYLRLDGEKVVNCGSSPSSREYSSIIVDSGHEILRDVRGWYFKNGELIKDEEEVTRKQLEIARNKKDIELSNACNTAILNGFEYRINGIPYHFSFDVEAQFNFQGADRVLQKGLITEIPWTAVNKLTGKYERVLIDADLMDELSMVILIHKNSNVSKYRDFLYVQLENAETIEEVESINW